MSDLRSWVWEYVGPVSAGGGLVSFLFSSTYEMSFGKWGCGGLLAYLFVGLVMWCLVFLVKSIEVPENYRDRVLATTFVVICAISVLLDKSLAGKSDAWSIISYGLFALMSLSVSRRSRLGFETGFSAFFLTFFIEELLKISWIYLLLLAFVLLYVWVIPMLRCNNSESRVQPPDSPMTEEVLLQSRSSMTSQQNYTQEQPSQAQNNEDEENRPLLRDTHRSSGMEEISEESTSERGDEHNNEAEEDPSSLAAVSGDQDHVPSGNSDVILQIDGTPELRRRRGRWMPRGIPDMSSRVEHTLRQLRRQVAPRSFNVLFFFQIE